MNEEQISATTASRSSASSNADSNNKLKDGPCSKCFTLLEQCQQGKNIKKVSNALTFCVSETDLLIRCIRKNPLYYQSK